MRFRTLVATAWTVLILVATLFPARWMGPHDANGPLLFGIAYLDKVVHLGLFVVYGFLWPGPAHPTAGTRRSSSAGSCWRS